MKPRRSPAPCRVSRQLALAKRAALALTLAAATGCAEAPLSRAQAAVAVGAVDPRATIEAEPAPRAPGWELVWSDEFDTDGPPNTATWSYEHGRVRNDEAQYYTDGRAENARVESGLLVLEARKERFAGAEYTSASLITRGKRDFFRGRLEVRAKLPRGRGSWPAIWLLGSDISSVGWPRCGEIDVMENVGFEGNVVHSTVHAAGLGGAASTASTVVTDPWNEFHTYGLTWTDTQLTISVDEVETLRITNDGKGDTATWPFSQPFYLLLNIAVGGSWGGAQGIEESSFPLKMYVDYIRYYRQAPL
ncbi:MAG TPA: glycoside hydrolase family 16 protein [Polyangiaceae bacterium]|nr:glycoside hydrolase family 16 protein [Polyangiaceae bacterium]